MYHLLDACRALATLDVQPALAIDRLRFPVQDPWGCDYAVARVSVATLGRYWGWTARTRTLGWRTS